MKDYFLLAFKNVRKRGVRSWLTMLGIFLGIAAVVSLISLGAGLQNAITGQFSTLDADKLVIQNTGTGFGPPGSTAITKLDSDDLKLVKSVNNVEHAIPRLIRVVKIEYNKISLFRNIASIPNNKEEIAIINDALNVEIAQGRLLEVNDKEKIVLGSSFSEDHFGKTIRIGTNLQIQDDYFEVVGILEESGSFITNNLVLIPETDLKKVLEIGEEIDTIIVQVENEDNIKLVSEDIERKIRNDRNQKIGEEDFSVQTPLQSVSAINTILVMINIIVSGIAAISLIVGGIGIANTMYTSVLERTKEIGVMKAIGGQNKEILSIFLIEAALLGLVGGIIGALMGLSLAFGVSSLAGANFKVTLSVPLLLLAIGFSLLIGIVSGIIPALQASKLNPVEALRK